MIEHHLYAFKADCVWFPDTQSAVFMVFENHSQTVHDRNKVCQKSAQLVDEHSTGLTDVQNPGSTSITRKRVQN